MMTSLQKQQFEKQAKVKDVGFTIRQVGIGDGIQFTSLPENYFRATGEKLIDVSQPWYFDYNPYVLRGLTPKRSVEMWNYPKLYEWDHPRASVYTSNAEVHCSVFDVKHPKLIRPRLYKHEEMNFRKRHTILFHPHGKSHGSLPDHVIQHVVNKYDVWQIGTPDEPLVKGCLAKLHTPTLWDLVKAISEARMLIGIDSGPAWIAACFPDVIVKKIRTKFQEGFCESEDWVSLDVRNQHSYWDDQGLFKIFNCFEHDSGFTESYKKL